MGPSSVREAFDVQIMDETASAYNFFNGGTTGGSIFLNELLLMIVQQYHVSPECIVIGVNSRLLVDRKLGMSAYGFTDHMDRWNGWELVKHEVPELRNKAFRDVLANSIVPLRRHSRQINMLIRYGLYRLQKRFPLVKTRPRRQFELKSRELEPVGKFLYSDTKPRADYLERTIEHWKKKGLYDKKKYAREKHKASLRASLDRCLEITPNVVVVIMPEHSLLRSSFGSYADKPMKRILRQYEKKGCLIVDKSEFLPDSSLRDGGHLLPHGRKVFSEEMARIISSYLAKRKVH
jgi:hypothetical protein